MHIKELKISELQAFIESDFFTNSKDIPITPHRVLSQINNPRAQVDDVVLIAAYNESNDLLGYVGALPDKISGNHKITWNSCWYADPKLGKTIALPLFLQFVKKWKGKILLRDLTGHTRKIIQSLPYFRLVKVEHSTRYYTRFYTSDLLAQKRPALAFLKTPLKLVDFLFNSYIILRQKTWVKKHQIPISVKSELVFQIDDQANNFLQSKNKNELICRGKKELEWIMNYPWVLEKTSENKSFINKYFFSSLARSFNYYRLKIENTSGIIGFFILKERDNHFEIPYAYFDDNCLKDISVCLIKFMFSKKIRSLNVVNAKLRKSFEELKVPCIYSNTTDLELYASKELSDIMGNDFEMQDGDGDGVFT